MEGLLIDLMVIIFAFGALLTGIGIAKVVRKKEIADKPETKLHLLQEKGKHNAKELDLHNQLICTSCGKETNPEVDIFENDVWWHKECLKKVIDEIRFS